MGHAGLEGPVGRRLTLDHAGAQALGETGGAVRILGQGRGGDDAQHGGQQQGFRRAGKELKTHLCLRFRWKGRVYPAGGRCSAPRLSSHCTTSR